MTIYFCGPNDKYECFSNFSEHGFELDGHFWKTSEHYFQAQKFYGTPYMCEIKDSRTPWRAFKLGNSRKHKIRDDWELVKEEVMFNGNLAKFKSHPDILSQLLETGEEELSKRYDVEWGCGPDGKGENKLGKILMRVREILKQ